MKDIEADGLTFTESQERSWRAYLADFRDNVWPVFQEYGFTSMDAAFQCWIANRLNNDVRKLLDRMEEREL